MLRRICALFALFALGLAACGGDGERSADRAGCGDTPETPKVRTGGEELALAGVTFVKCPSEGSTETGHGEGFRGKPPTLAAGTSAIVLEVPEAERWAVEVQWSGGKAERDGTAGSGWSLPLPQDGCHRIDVSVRGDGGNSSSFVGLVRSGPSGKACTTDAVTETDGACPASAPEVTFIVAGEEVTPNFEVSRLCTDGPSAAPAEEDPFVPLQPVRFTVDPSSWESTDVALGVQATGVGYKTWSAAIDWPGGAPFETTSDGIKLLPTLNAEGCYRLDVELSKGKGWVRYGADIEVGQGACA